MLTQEIKNSIDESILGWLATANKIGEPNCSPKEVFTYLGDSHILVAHIASPISVRNVKENANVCLSFVHVYKQKGFKVTGTAEYIAESDGEFDALYQTIKPISGDFPVKGIIRISVNKAQPIIAPSYFLVEGTTEASQIENAKQAYNAV